MLVNITRRAKVDEYRPDKPPDEYSVTAVGRLQAHLLATRLYETQAIPDIVYSGSSARHRETADVIARTIGRITGTQPEVQTLTELRDAEWTTRALQTCYDEVLSQREWSKRMARGELSFDETVSEVQDRLRTARHEIVANTDSEASVLVVTSAIPVQLLVFEVLELDLSNTALPVNNMGIFELTWGQRSDSVRQLNSTSHLPGNLQTRDYFVSSNRSES